MNIKYTFADDWSNYQPPHAYSSVWRFKCFISSPITNKLRWQVDNRKQIFISSNPWINTIPLDRMAVPYRIELVDEIHTVTDLFLEDGQWNISIFQSIFYEDNLCFTKS